MVLAPKPKPAVPPPGIVRPPARPTNAKKNIPRAAILTGVAGVAIFSAVGFFVFRKLSANRKAEEAEMRVTAQETKKAASSPAPNATSPVAPSPSSSAVATPAASAAPAATTAASTANLPPAATAVAKSEPKPIVPLAPEPSPEIKAWVNGLRISGVRRGDSPKVLIDRKTFSVGDFVNAEQGITFDGFDASREMIRFKDKEGALYERRAR